MKLTAYPVSRARLCHRLGALLAIASASACASSAPADGSRVPSPRRESAALEPAETIRPSFRIPAQSFDDWMASGPGPVLARIPLEPVRDSRGKFVAFRIGRLDPPFHAPNSGLLIGDQVREINDVRIVSPADFFAAWKAVQKEREIRVEILRSSNEMALQWDVD